MDRTDRLVSVCMMSTEEHFASIFSFLRYFEHKEVGRLAICSA